MRADEFNRDAFRKAIDAVLDDRLLAQSMIGTGDTLEIRGCHGIDRSGIQWMWQERRIKCRQGNIIYYPRIQRAMIVGPARSAPYIRTYSDWVFKDVFTGTEGEKVQVFEWIGYDYQGHKWRWIQLERWAVDGVMMAPVMTAPERLDLMTIGK